MGETLRSQQSILVVQSRLSEAAKHIHIWSNFFFNFMKSVFKQSCSYILLFYAFSADQPDWLVEEIRVPKCLIVALPVGYLFAHSSLSFNVKKKCIHWVRNIYSATSYLVVSHVIYLTSRDGVDKFRKNLIGVWICKKRLADNVVLVV